MDPGAVLVDGVPREWVGVTDRGLAFGDGVFRTIAVRGGRPLNWRWQHRRLRADCEVLRLQPPAEDALLRELAQVAPGDAVAKVIVTRGESTRGYAISASTRPTRIVMAFPPSAHPPGHAERGVATRRCALVLSEQPRLAGAKTLNRLENVLARSEWDDAAIAEGLLGDARGHVVAGTMSNLFVVSGGRAATPELSRCGVVGAQRERVRKILERAGIACAVCDLAWEALAAADEVFLTNSLIGVWPVVAHEGRSWPVGAVTRRVQAMLAEEDEAA